MTDKEIIEGVIARDNGATALLLSRYRPLFVNAARLVFDGCVDTDECINELYLYLMHNDAEKLRSFEWRSSLGSWLKMVTIRFFMSLKKRNKVVQDVSTAPEVKEQDTATNSNDVAAKIDVERLLALLQNERYAMVIRKLILEEEDPEQLAEAMGVKVSNLYNIKKRAFDRLVEVTIKERRCYEFAR